MFLNLIGFGAVLDPETRERMFIGATLVSAAGVVFLLLDVALDVLGYRRAPNPA